MLEITVHFMCFKNEDVCFSIRGQVSKNPLVEHVYWLSSLFANRDLNTNPVIYLFTSFH